MDLNPDISYGDWCPSVETVTETIDLTQVRKLASVLDLDEAAFEGTGVFLIGALLDEFFSQYVSINSFAETVVKTVDRGEVMRWPVRAGRRQTL